MNRSITTALAMAGALTVGLGSAHAATLNADMNITANVSASCDFGGPGDRNFTLDAMNSQTSGTATVLVSCNLYLPYIIEADAGPDGLLTLTDAMSGETLPVHLRYDMGGGFYGAPWGTQANAEHWSGTGTGSLEFKSFQMLVNGPGSGGGSFDPLPQVGTYTQILNLTLTY